MAKEARYTEQISAMVDADTKARIGAIDQEYPAVSQGDVIRKAIEFGLPRAENHFRAGSRSDAEPHFVGP